MYGHLYKIYMYMSVLIVIPPTINCLKYSERRIIEFEKGEFEDMSYRNRLQNMGYEFLFKIVDDFYVFATNKSWSTEEHEHFKHINVGKSFCQCPPYFDEVQEIDQSWVEGYTGKNVVIAVTDVGVDSDSPNLRENIAFDLSYNFIDNNTDPRPEIFPNYPESLRLTNHGNACSGLIAGIKENDICSFCGAGVAFNSKVAALKIGKVKYLHWEYNPEITGGLYSAALRFKNQEIHIYSNSWTFDEPFKTLHPPTERVLEVGLEKGRQGLGSIFVFPSGPHGNGFTNNIFTIGVASFGFNGIVPRRSFVSSATLVSAFGQGRRRIDNGTLTVTHTIRRLASRTCDNKFGGSSAATAIVSGMIALTLEANSALTSRDIKHLLVESSGYIGLAETSHFKMNCAGKHFHKVFGFGYVQVLKMVHLAKHWKFNLQLLNLTYVWFDIQHNQTDIGYELVSSSNLTCQHKPYCIDKMEHIIVKLRFVYPRHTRTILSIISPCGTESILMEHAGEPPKDENDVGKNEGVSVDATFLSNHFWGEEMEGIWTVKITGLGVYSYLLCNIERAEIMFYGTNKHRVIPIVRLESPNITESSDRKTKGIQEEKVNVGRVVGIPLGITIPLVIIIILCCCKYKPWRKPLPNNPMHDNAIGEQLLTQIN
ncbi:PCSK4-like protein [Mya arenaria]|uniref:PCSK4-like protein n=1 Tax=Mya arenaria TaxID=6604 RepID=A0ABY7EI36_MYAAR|nr:PCSK4-like protein [Mya arenaria]